MIARCEKERSDRGVHRTTTDTDTCDLPTTTKNADDRIPRMHRLYKNILKILLGRTLASEQNTISPRYFSLWSSTTVDPTRVRRRSTATGWVGRPDSLIRTCRREALNLSAVVEALPGTMQIKIDS